METIELLVLRDGHRTLLSSPEVGLFTCAAPKGRVVGPGEELGSIRTLGVSRTLLVPPGVRGRVVNARPERVLSAVQYGEQLYELEAAELAAHDELDPSGALPLDASSALSDLVVLSPYAGRFWHRASPGEPPLATEGQIVEDGQPIGLIEVMKTFTRVPYRAQGSLPARARVLRMLVGDGAETVQGQALLAVEPVAADE
jgi:acetyl-CoA carboxylase biotin carboxyl carrier protein